MIVSFISWFNGYTQSQEIPLLSIGFIFKKWYYLDNTEIIHEKEYREIIPPTTDTYKDIKKFTDSVFYKETVIYSYYLQIWKPIKNTHNYRNTIKYGKEYTPKDNILHKVEGNEKLEKYINENYSKVNKF